jgi:hypothetical protein
MKLPSLDEVMRQITSLIPRDPNGDPFDQFDGLTHREHAIVMATTVVFLNLLENLQRGPRI